MPHRNWPGKVLAACLIISVATATAVAADEGSPSRWAILSTLSSANQRTADLLLERLSNDDNFELVDREEVQAVSDELAFAAIGEAVGTQQRRQMGQRLSADMLLILDEVSLVETAELATSERANPGGAKVEATGLRVVICATSAGARLHTRVLSHDGQSAKDAVGQIYETAKQIRNRFAGGIRYIVGVSPFQSQILTHDFDSYQAGLAHLLESRFSTLPGIAVVEREEAQSIWDEIADKRALPADRPIPLLVEGEFRTTPVRNVTPALSVAVIGRFPATQPLRFDSGALALPELPEWISSLPSKLLDPRSENGRDSFAKDDQFRWLVERAHGFSKVGDWNHAIGLRQAALLLEPRNGAERLSLIDDQRSLLSGIISRKIPMPDWLGPSDETRAAKISAIYLNQLANQEYLIRNSLVDKKSAAKLVGFTQRSLAFGQRARNEPETAYTRAFAQAEEFKKAYLWNIAPLLFEVPDPATPRFTQRGSKADLQDVLLNQAGQRLDREPMTDDDLAYLARLWSERVPDDLGFSGVVATIRYQYFPDTDRVSKPKTLTHGRLGERGGLSRSDWMAFLERLASTNHRTARLTARIELLVWKWYLVDQQTPLHELTKLRELADEIALELRQYVDTEFRGRSIIFGGGSYPQRFDEIYWQLERLKSVSSPYAERRQLKPAPAKEKPRFVVDRNIDPQSAERVRVVDLHFSLPVRSYDEYKLEGPVPPALRRSLRQIPGDGFYGEVRWVNWGEHADIVWTPLEIHWMRQPGKFEKLVIPARTNTVFDDVRPDGQLLWVTTLAGGIWVLDLSAEVVAHVTEEHGLPPAEHGMRLQPIGSSKACVAGSFGQNWRGWCAIIDIAGSKPNVNIFHEAKLVKDWRTVSQRPTRGDNSEDDLNQAFIPNCLFAHTARDGRRQIYVFRSRPDISSDEQPLVIDLESLKVSLGDLPVAFRGMARMKQHDRFLSHEGEVVHITRLENFRPKAGTRFAPPRVAHSQGFIEFDDYFYVPDRVGWFRFDLQSGTYENLSVGTFARGPYDMKFARSAHFGIVGWSSEPFRTSPVQQIVIDENATGDQHVVETRTADRVSQRAHSNSPRVKAQTNRDFPLSENEKQQLISNVRELLANPPKVPADALVLYQNGHHLVDNWLPGTQVHDCWLDPPEKKEGCRFVYSNGRVVFVEYLTASTRDVSYTIWHGSFGEPILVKYTFQEEVPGPRITRDPKTGRFPERLPEELYRPPSYRENFRYSAALYDDDGLLSRVVKLDANFKIVSMMVFEHAADYQSVTTHYCDAAGRCSHAREELPLDTNGQRIPLGSAKPIAYSSRFEEVTTPQLVGLSPYYPILGHAK